jgi:hypothetical protein
MLVATAEGLVSAVVFAEVADAIYGCDADAFVAVTLTPHACLLE